MYENFAHLGCALGAVAAALAVLHLLERRVSRYLSHRLGWRSVLFTGWIGVPLHELSHLLAARLFGHRIVAYQLFDPDPVSGTLGYVRHAYSRRNLWQLTGSFVIGVAPMVTGGAALVALLYGAVPREALNEVMVSARGSGAWQGAWLLGSGVLDAVWTHRTEWLPLYGYVALCVASHLSPSASDLKNGALGAVLVSLLLAGATAGLSYGGQSLASLGAIYLPLVALVTGVATLQLTYVTCVAGLHRLGWL
ncbi:MAG: hypothetical protein AAFQ82_13435 [Myxococcota bacterium]